jgi:O-antigen ligase
MDHPAPHVASQPARGYPTKARNSLGFALFIVVNASLFVRPAELVPAVIGWPIYLVLILVCLAISLPQVLRQLTARSLKMQPITACVLGLQATVVLSLLANLDVAGAGAWGLEFFKVVVYYLLLVGLVTSAGRIRVFLTWFAAFSVLVTLLAVLQYHGAITLPNLKTLTDRAYDAAAGTDVLFRRLQGTGIFQDPNDFCLILVVGAVISLYGLCQRRASFLRFCWLGPLLLFGYALFLTRSRGGFLAFLVGVLVYFRARFGLAKTLLLSALFVPIVFALFAGRQTALSVHEKTGQSRIQLWSDALMLFRQNPLFGVGVDHFEKGGGHVVHNSFLHSFTEMGLAGGVLFLGAFAFALLSLYRLGSRRRNILDPEFRQLQPVVLAIVAAYSTGMLSLSVGFLVPTFTILGLACVCLRLTPVDQPLRVVRCGGRFLMGMTAISLVFLLSVYIFVRIFIRWA